MKQKKRYESPISEEIAVKHHGILCQSPDATVSGQQSNYNYYQMDGE